MEVSWEQALAWRMGRQHLVVRAPTQDLVAVVDRLCGLHAQVMSSVELALAARVDGLTREAVQDALWEQRSLVKLWAMRGTLHVLPASGLGLWLAGMRTFPQRYDWMLDPLALEVTDLVGKALHGEVLTRMELVAAVGRLSRSTAKAEVLNGSWGGYLKPASFQGRLCFAPSDGQRVRFTSPATWLGSVPEAVDVDVDQALATIAGRYLSGYGPASATELAAWWGVNRVEATRMLAMLGDTVTEVSVEGTPYWMLSEHVADLASTPGAKVVRLLPGFDQWVVCASRRDRLGSRPGPGLPALDPAHRKRIYRLQGWVSPVVLVDGRMAGVWKHERRGRRLRVEVDPFGKLSRPTKQLVAAEAECLAAFVGGELQLTIG